MLRPDFADRAKVPDQIAGQARILQRRPASLASSSSSRLVRLRDPGGEAALPDRARSWH